MSKKILSDLAGIYFKSSKTIKSEVRAQLREDFDNLLNSKVVELEKKLVELKTICSLIDEHKCFFLYQDAVDCSYFYLDSEGREYEYSKLFDRNFLVSENMEMYEITDAIKCGDLYPRKYDDNRTKITKIVTAVKI